MFAFWLCCFVFLWIISPIGCVLKWTQWLRIPVKPIDVFHVCKCFCWLDCGGGPVLFVFNCFTVIIYVVVNPLALSLILIRFSSMRCFVCCINTYSTHSFEWCFNFISGSRTRGCSVGSGVTPCIKYRNAVIIRDTYARLRPTGYYRCVVDYRFWPTT